jgi:hypothetical protein
MMGDEDQPVGFHSQGLELREEGRERGRALQQGSRTMQGRN